MANLKKNWQIITIGLVTFILAAIAVVTAWRLYQIGREPVAPTAPTSEPRAADCTTFWYYDNENRVCQQKEFCDLYMYEGLMTFATQEECQTSLSAADACALEFTLEASPSPSPSPSPGCYEECEIDGEDCPGDYVCQDVDGTNLCVNEDCSDEEDCVCPSPSPSPSPSASPSPSPSVSPSPSPSVSPSPSLSAVPSPSPKPSPSPEVELPEAGIISPTLLVTLGGIILILIGLFL